MYTKEHKLETISASNKEDMRKQLLNKLHSKIKLKQMVRMNTVKKKEEVYDYCKKIGISEDDIQTLTELSNKFVKKK